jgi:endonuclease YncB( thermonuclease family)
MTKRRAQRAAEIGLVTKLPRMIALLVSALGFAALVADGSMVNASPLDPGQVEVVDGDTVRIAGETFRLVGFDAPETYRARCPSERELGNRATFRLRQLVAGGGLDLERVACSCRAGTEGTPRCNYGRSCGTLTARGRDVGLVLIAEGLARPFVCGRTSCPSRESWCTLETLSGLRAPERSRFQVHKSDLPPWAARGFSSTCFQS